MLITNLPVLPPGCKPPVPFVFSTTEPVETEVAIAFFEATPTIWVEPEFAPRDAYIEAQMEPRGLYRAPQHPGARTWQVMPMGGGAAHGQRR